MNKYGARLMRQWQTADPERFAQIPDPEEFFTQMGADLEERIDALARATAGPDRLGEDYLEKVARLTSARVNAESDLIREAMIPEPGEEIEEPLPPEWRSIWTHDPEYETDSFQTRPHGSPPAKPAASEPPGQFRAATGHSWPDQSRRQASGLILPCRCKKRSSRGPGRCTA